MKKALLIIILLSFSFPGCGKKNERSEYDSYGRTLEVMGTFMEIRITNNEFTEDKIERIIDEAFQLAFSLERKLSIYEIESEINLLNDLRILNVSRDLFFILTASLHIGRLTDGEFDITVSPLMKKNGFYGAMPESILDKIPDTTSGIGWENITTIGNRKVILTDENTWIDLSGIAKGYIVDRVSAFLREQGVNYFLVNAGGDIYCGDKEPSSGGWLVGVREPGGNSVIKILSLKNTAIATSGDYENIVIDEITGEVLSHIIDPVQKKAMIETLSSVTVISSACTNADAFATGMMAMGEARAIALANSLDNVEIITSHRNGDENNIRYSSGAEKFVLERPL